ncbi:hypothetical protein GCM10009118_19560 [Wandonia haliotis]|uniref:Uncharacterized protein n=1 Tax=Wandonia haliotis TaxID=574963 RepID=A0ABN1MQE1_9FLAO
MKHFLLVITLLSTFFVSAQKASTFTGEEKAYMYHVVMKSPILRDNIGRYFEYSGPQVYFRDTLLNYDSIDILIMNEPELLFIRSSEIAKKSPGIVAELANKMAIWELNKTLLAYKQQDEDEMARFKGKFEDFEKLLLEHIPSSLLRKTNSGQHTFDAKLHRVINPSLSFSEKATMIGTFHGISIEDQERTLVAINQSINEWVKQRTYDLFTQLGAKTTRFQNELIAAGDGSMTSGLLNEREKDEQGRWNRGLPRAVGLFPYQTYIGESGEKKQPTILPERFASLHLQTTGNGRITNIHPDVWGYNDKKQTTVVIEKNSKSYVLFGSGDTRFLSPDSSFSEGKTFYSCITELENKWIRDLKEMIYGKKGFDFWINYWEEERIRTLNEIKKLEIDLSDLRMSGVSNTKKGKKERKKDQEILLGKYNYLSECESTIKKLKKEKEEALILLADYERLLDKYKQLIGYNWVKWTENDGLYTFEDGSTFNLYTQDFRFPAHTLSEKFEVRLLAIPFTALSDQADEVMLHLSLSDMEPGFDQTFRLTAEDLFHSNSYLMSSSLFTPDDSVAVVDLLNAIYTKPKIDIIARGQGVGEWKNGQVQKQHPVLEEAFYPGETEEDKLRSKEDSAYKSLRRTEVFIDTKSGITMEINSYTDPVRTDFTPSHPELNTLKTTGKITGNESLSAYRSAVLLKTLQEELNLLAGTYLSREKAKVVIDHLNKAFVKAKISISMYSVPFSEFTF